MRLSIRSSCRAHLHRSTFPARQKCGPPAQRVTYLRSRLNSSDVAQTAAQDLINGAQDAVGKTLDALDSLLQQDADLQQSSGTSETETALPSPPQQLQVAGAAAPEVDSRKEPSVLEAYARKAWNLGLGSLRDAVKPTTIIDEDPNLPRVQARFSYAVLAINILVYAVGLSFMAVEGQDGPTDYFLSLAKVNDAIEAGEYHRILTSNFLHDSFMHLGLSSYALLTFAPEAEAILGSFTFLTTYVLGGASGTILCFLLSDTLTVGASSGIFGLIGALGAFLYKNHKVPHSSEQVLMTAGLVAFNLFIGGNKETAVDNLGHLGGLAAGIYLGMLLTPAVVVEEEKEKEKFEAHSTSTDFFESPSVPGAGKEKAVNSRGQAEAASAAADKKAVRVIQPNPLQSFAVLLCMTMTLSSSVAAAVLYRTGELPLPKGISLPFL